MVVVLQHGRLYFGLILKLVEMKSFDMLTGHWYLFACH